jgi:hypothetical protein
MVLISSKGMTLAFKNEKDLANVIQNLQSMKRHKRGRGYPATMLIYEPKGVTEKEAQEQVNMARMALSARRKR